MGKKTFKIDSNDKIPNRFWGIFYSDNISNYFDFYKSEQIIDLKVNLNFEIEEKEIDKLKTWDCLPVNRSNIFLINSKVQQFFTEFCPTIVEFITPNTFQIGNDNLDLDYKLLHVLSDLNEALIYRGSDIGTLIASDSFVKEIKKRNIKGFSFRER